MSVAAKEARETLYWLELLEASGWSKPNLNETLKFSHELVKLLTAIVKTTSLPKPVIKNYPHFIHLKK